MLTQGMAGFEENWEDAISRRPDVRSAVSDLG